MTPSPGEPSLAHTHQYTRTQQHPRYPHLIHPLKPPHSSPVAVQQFLHALSLGNASFHLVNRPRLEPVARWKIRVPELRFIIHQMVKRKTELLIGVALRIVLIDPPGEAGADFVGIVPDGVPVGLVFDLGVNKGHFLGARNALKSSPIIIKKSLVEIEQQLRTCSPGNE